MTVTRVFGTPRQGATKALLWHHSVMRTVFTGSLDLSNLLLFNVIKALCMLCIIMLYSMLHFQTIPQWLGHCCTCSWMQFCVAGSNLKSLGGEVLSFFATTCCLWGQSHFLIWLTLRLFSAVMRMHLLTTRTNIDEQPLSEMRLILCVSGNTHSIAPKQTTDEQSGA